ncbi:MAG: GntR family transcriptional regulator [Pirellulales bacterium]
MKTYHQYHTEKNITSCQWAFHVSTSDVWYSEMHTKGWETGATPIGRVRRRKPKRERLRSHLLSEIAAGTLNPGDALFAERHLAEIMQVSRSTVRQTLDDLEREGIVHRVQGKGTFVSERRKQASSGQTAANAIVVLDVSSRYYLSLLAGFEKACARAGHPALICNSEDSIDRQGNHLMGLLAHRVSGVALNACARETTPPYHVELLQDAGIPVVLLHRPIPNVCAPLLELPAEEMGQSAARLLIEAGHQRVAFFDSRHCDLSTRTETSFRATLASAGIALPESCVEYASESGGWKSTSALDEYDRYLENVLPRFLSQPNPPTAIFSAFDPLAEHIYLAAQRLGVRIPEDLSIVTVGGVHRVGAILKRMTGVLVDEVKAGSKAVELLEEMRAGKRPIDDTEVFSLPLSCFEGETLGPPKNWGR